MGTRADFYVEKDKGLKWLGSIAWDGYPEGIEDEVFKATNPDEFVKSVKKFLKNRRGNDGTFPKDGWPWPWEDSHTTDYAYAFRQGAVYGACFGDGWWPIKGKVKKNKVEWELKGLPKEDSGTNKRTVPDFPNMKKDQKVTLGKRSGLIVIGGGMQEKGD